MKKKNGFFYSLTGHFILWNEKRKLFKAMERLNQIQADHERYLIKTRELDRE